MSAVNAGMKRKRESKSSKKFYAVKAGKAPGIYNTWDECSANVHGFKGAIFKSFPTLVDAQRFIQGEIAVKSEARSEPSKAVVPEKPGKWYGVQNGTAPGVYGNWKEALEQLKGYQDAKHGVFKTRAEAEQYVAQRDTKPMVDDMGSPSSKKAKRNEAARAGPGEYGEFETGDGPLPEDAEDNFDTSITLDHSIGNARYKSGVELARTTHQVSGPAPDAPIKIYTDGSSLANGQAGAIAGVGVYFGPLDSRNISESLSGTKQTNQRAELTAILRALEVAPIDRKIIIVSDSKYAISCSTEWFKKWRTNGWVNSAGKPVENKDLVQKVIEVLEERQKMNAHRPCENDAVVDASGPSSNGVVEKGVWEKGAAGVKFVWVKGHAKDEGNEAADQLAVAAANDAKAMNIGDEEYA